MTTKPQIASTYQRTLRRVLRHLGFSSAGILIIALVAFWSNKTGDDNIMGMGASPLIALGLGTAYASLVFLSLALLIGPWRMLKSKKPMISSYLRRDLGIWAALLAIVHSILSLVVKIGPFSALDFFFFRGKTESLIALRFDFFGLANYSGLIAGLVLLVPLAISSDAALRKLKPALWKSLQRWTYWGALITVVHGLMYQMMAVRSLPFVVLMGGIIFVALGGQVWGAVLNRRGSRTSRPEGSIS
jgi:sulfoxide reductase heme-binding subunit YedZ